MTHEMGRLRDEAALAHRRGEVAAAAALCLRGLAIHPGDDELRHRLAICRYQQGEADKATATARIAIAVNPGDARYLSTLGTIEKARAAAAARVLMRRACLLDLMAAELRFNLANGLLTDDMAEVWRGYAAIRQAIILKPEDIRFYKLLQSFVERVGGDVGARRIISLDRWDPDVYVALGDMRRGAEAHEAAVVFYRYALALDPAHSGALTNMTAALRTLGRTDEALAAITRMVLSHPTSAEARANLGTLLRDKGRNYEAVAAYRRALEQDPHLPIAYNLCEMLIAQGRLDEAEIIACKAIILHPDMSRSWAGYGLVLRDASRYEEAERALRRAVRLEPDNSELAIVLGSTLIYLGRDGEAELECQRGVDLGCRAAGALATLGLAQWHGGELELGVETYREAMAVDPSFGGHLHNYLFLNNYLGSLSARTVFDEHARIGVQLSETFEAERRLNHGNERSPERKLRIAYVSPDLKNHSVAFFIAPVMSRHDHSQFEIYCYSDVRAPDHVTARLQGLADRWVATGGLSDAALARRIRADGIDILIDLAGHTAGNRLSVFARKPAPVQMTWIGYPNTSGLPEIDYRIVDAITDPPGAGDALNIERLIRLEDGFLCYEPAPSMPDVAPPPVVKNGYVTFGCFNNLSKVTEEVVATWCCILQRTPNARIIVKAKQLACAVTRERYRRRFLSHGIAEDRFDLLAFLPTTIKHLDAYGMVDIALDPFPYNGTTTTCEALLMGVPVLTIRGDRHAARVGASLLTRVGAAELIADDIEHHIDIAARLAADPAALTAWRQRLRGALLSSPLCQADSFTRKLEAAYREAWRDWSRTAADALAAADVAEMTEPEPKIDVQEDLGILFQEATRLYVLGDYAGALRGCEAILNVDPDFADAVNLKGVLLSAEGRFDEAVALIRKAIRWSPSKGQFYMGLAMTLRAAGRLDEAVEAFETARGMMNFNPSVHFQLGLLHQNRGDYQAAVPCYEAAVRAAPNMLDAHNNLGLCLRALGRVDEASRHIRNALRFDPAHIGALSNYGVCRREVGDFDSAVHTFRRIMAVEPAFAAGFSNLSAALLRKGRFIDAGIAAQRACLIEPNNSALYANLALVANSEGRLSVAEWACAQALRLGDRGFRTLYHLANTLRDQGRLPEALAAFVQALEARLQLGGGGTELASAYLFTLNYGGGPSPQAVYEAHRRWAPMAVGNHVPATPPVFANTPDPERRLRVGYVSADFFHHSVSFFFEPLLEGLDRTRVEVFCYSNTALRDEATRRLQTLADHWTDIFGLGDDEAAARIRADGVDILVDLSGHTSGNRLGVFAREPAPVRMTWLGYPNTTGLACIDYRVTDAVADPPGEADQLSVERLIRLPDGFLCFKPPAAAPEVQPPPSTRGAPVTFGSFSNLAKITDAVVKTWARILTALPNARLIVKCKHFIDPNVRAHFAGRFARHGVAADRISSLPLMSDPKAHLGLYGDIDIALDPYPYNGTTTTCEALWMGAPVMTIRGDRHAARVSASILQMVGMPELIARDEDDLVAKAIALALDPSRLAALRARARERMRASPLCDGPGFARRMETAYREAWRAWSRTRGVPSGDAEAEALVGQAFDRLRGNQGAGGAMAVLRSALAAAPALPRALRILTATHGFAGRMEDVARWGARAVRLDPWDAHNWHNVANAASARGDAPTAARLLRIALAIDPVFADAWCSLAHAARLMDQGEDGLRRARRADMLAPASVRFKMIHGECAEALGRREEATAVFKRVFALEPSSIEGARRVAAAAAEALDLSTARTIYDRCLRVDGRSFEALNNMGALCWELGDVAGAMSRFAQARAQNPSSRKAYSNYLHAANFSDTLAPSELARAHWAYDQAFPTRPRVHMRPADALAVTRRLRVGYVSADFCGHSVAFFFMPPLMAHGPAVETFCYADVERPDAYTDRLRGVANHWRSIVGMDDAAVARLIEADGIDILVDLAGHTARNRLGVFAFKPAPVQATWLGYPNTTGLAAIDYRLTDAVADPPGEADDLCRERLVRLPQGFLCYAPGPSAPETAPPPALVNGYVTFGSFNNLSKLTPATATLWSGALLATPGSRLLLKARGLADPATRERVTGLFAERGVAPERLELLPFAPHLRSHLEIYGRVDIALDPHPYNGATTTCEALWMGAPTLTMRGDRHAARVGASLLTRVGLPQLVAEDPDDFAARAARLAADVDGLAALRAGLRARVASSPLCDAPGFARALEDAYRAMWRAWLAG